MQLTISTYGAKGRALVGHGYTWEIERAGLVVYSEYDVLGAHHSLKEAPPTPYRLHVRVDGGRCYLIDIQNGQAPIWEHRTTESVAVFDGTRVIQDSVIFGKREPDGSETVLRAYPDGQAFEFTSLDAARAHQLV